MRALITGGAGFIGSHLSEHLLKGGHTVIALDNLSTGRAANVAHLRANPNFELFVEDGQDLSLLESLTARSDVVFHMAAAVGVQKIIDEPIRTLTTNIHFTELVLRAASRTHKRVLIASSSEVYGRSNNEWFTETDDLLIGSPHSRRWGYAASKLVDEFLALAYHHEQRLPVTCMRLFNTVGPRQTGRYGMVIPRLVSQALRNEPLTIFGDGTQRRTFTDVRESVRALVEIVACEKSHGQVINLGGAAEVSINDLADRIIALTNSKSTKRLVPYGEAYGEAFEDMRRRNPAMGLLKSLIGWAPSANLDTILTAVIDDIRARIADGRDA